MKLTECSARTQVKTRRLIRVVQGPRRNRPARVFWQPSTRWPASWPCTAPSTSLGPKKSALYLSRNTRRHPPLLEKAEIDALLAAPNLKRAQGQRDHLPLLFLYNTGARADEAAQVLVGDLNFAHVPSRDLSWVKIRGKGNKLGHCPLWPQAVNELAAYDVRHGLHRIFGRDNWLLKRELLPIQM